MPECTYGTNFIIFYGDKGSNAYRKHNVGGQPSRVLMRTCA
jgi:hypothetical protein